jgi:hypothetical protein
VLDGAKIPDERFEEWLREVTPRMRNTVIDLARTELLVKQSANE